MTHASKIRDTIQLLCENEPPHTVRPIAIVKYLKERGCNVHPGNVSKEMKRMGYSYRKQTVGSAIKKAEVKQTLAQSGLENFHKQVTGGLEEHNKQKSKEPKTQQPKVENKAKPVKKNSEISKSHTYICIAKIEQGGFEYVW